MRHFKENTRCRLERPGGGVFGRALLVAALAWVVPAIFASTALGEEMTSSSYSTSHSLVGETGGNIGSVDFKMTVSAVEAPANGPPLDDATSFQAKAGYVHTLFHPNAPPVISGVSFTQVGSGSSTQFRIGYKLTDPDVETDITFVQSATQTQWSLDGAAWNNATISGTTSSLFADANGEFYETLFWDVYTDVGNTTPAYYYFRFRAHDGTEFAPTYWTTSAPIPYYQTTSSVLSSVDYIMSHHHAGQVGGAATSTNYKKTITCADIPARGAPLDDSTFSKVWAGYPHTLFYPLNYAPSVSNVTFTQVGSGPTTQYQITYTVFDADGEPDISFDTAATQVQYSVDGTNWSNATVSGTTNGISADWDGETYNTLYWDVYTDVGNTDPANFYVRLLPYDGSDYGTNYWTTPSTIPYYKYPDAPTALYVGNIIGGAQAGTASPATVWGGHIARDHTGVVFSAVFQDPSPGDVGTKYQVQVDDTADFSSVVWDSGSSGVALANTVAIGARCEDVLYKGTTQLKYETTYYWRIRFWDGTMAGNWSNSGENFTISIGVVRTTAAGEFRTGPSGTKIYGANKAVYHVVVDPGSAVTISLYIKKAAAYSGTEPTLKLFDIDGVTQLGSTVSTDANSSNAWYQYSLQSPAAISAKGVVRFEITTYDSASEIYMDDIASSQP